MTTIFVTGATGFIGRRVVEALARRDDCRIVVLSRSGRFAALPSAHSASIAATVKVVKGDLRDPASFGSALAPGCIVINLAYCRTACAEDNIAAARQFAQACRSADVARVVHCSTAVVATQEQVASANGLVTEYGMAKLEIERAFSEASRGAFDAGILRPGAVFGPGGENLRKLVGSLLGASRWRNYAKACLFGARRMNLVHVDNVVDALVFLAFRPAALGGEIFVVSDADDPRNNFVDVERMAMAALGLPDYPLPRVHVPLIVLASLLRVTRRDLSDPCKDYLPAKLVAAGFQRTKTLDVGVREFAVWYRDMLREGMTGREEQS